MKWGDEWMKGESGREWVNENQWKSRKMREEDWAGRRGGGGGGRSGLCTDVDGGRGDLSNGRLAEKNTALTFTGQAAAAAAAAATATGRKFMHALTLCYWLSAVRVRIHVHSHASMRRHMCVNERRGMRVCVGARRATACSQVKIEGLLSITHALSFILLSFLQPLSLSLSPSLSLQPHPLRALRWNSIRPCTMLSYPGNIAKTACGSEQLLYTISQEVLQIKHGSGHVRSKLWANSTQANTVTTVTE